MKEILIAISIDSVGAARLPQLFAAAGCRVTVVSGAGLAITASKYVQDHIVTERPTESVRAGLEEHLSYFPARYEQVIIADEPLLRTFTVRPATPLLARLAPVTADAEKLAMMLSKVTFSQTALAAGLPTPEFRVLPAAGDLQRELWGGKPFVIKTEESLSGSGVHVIRSAGDLEQAKALLQSVPLLIQQYIPGRVGATAVYFQNGEPKCWFSYYLCRNWPNANSASSAIQVVWRKDIHPILQKLGDMTGYTGLCGLDWVLDPATGKALVLEINPRPTPGLHASHLAQVCFAEAISQSLDGKALFQPAAKCSSRMYRLFPQNLFRSIDDRDLREFLRTWQDAPWRDPKLLLSQLRRTITHYLPISLRHRIKVSFRGVSTV